MVGDLAHRAAADRGDARNRQKIGDERVRPLGVGAGERSEHALIFRARVRSADGEPIEILRQRCLVVEVLDQAPLPGGREIECRDQGAKQRHVTRADVGCAQAVMRGRVEPERQHFGIRRRRIRPGEGFDAGLQEFAAALGAMPEHRTEIAKAPRLAGRGRGEIVARDWNGEVGAQAQFAPLRIGGEIHALADVLAGEVEERLRRLQNRRRHPRIARALERRDERVGRGGRRDCSGARHGAAAVGSGGGGGALACLGGEFDPKPRARLTPVSGRFRTPSANPRAPPPPARAPRLRRYRRAEGAARVQAAPRSAIPGARRVRPLRSLPRDR